MWGDAGPDRSDRAARRGRPLVVDLVLVALVPALAALAFAGVVGRDRWRSLDAAEARRDHVAAIAALAELRSVVALDEIFEVAARVDDVDVRTALDSGLGTSSSGNRSNLGPVVDRLVDLDIDRLTGRPASASSALEAIAALGVGRRSEVATRHLVASDRIDALMAELADADAVGPRVEPGLVRALASAEQHAADVLSLTASVPSPGSDASVFGGSVFGGSVFDDSVLDDRRRAAVVRLDETLARLRSELPPADSRRLATGEATLAPEVVAADTDGADVNPVSLAAARVDQLRALRRDYAAAMTTAADEEVAALGRQLRTTVLGVVGLVVLLCLLVGAIASRILGGLAQIDGRVRRLSAGELIAPSKTRPRGRELTQLGDRLDGIGSALSAVRDRGRQVATVDERLATDAPDGDSDPSNSAAGPLIDLLSQDHERIEARVDALEAREAFAQGLIDTTDEAIFTVDERSLVTWANAAAARLFSLPAEELTGSSVADLVVRLPMLAELPVGITNADSTVVSGTGGVRSVLVSTRLVGDDDHPVVAVFARDISERRELEHQLSHQATHDDLTGLGNRASLVAELDRARARAQRSGQGFGLLFIDLDRFKLVNDTLGHRTGDLVLRQIADRLRSATRDTDFVARNGGDEFVVIAEEATDIGTVVRLAERIQEELAVPLVIDDDAIPVSASIGVTWLDPDDDNSLDQLRNADVAMYQAKSSGPGQVRVFDEDMRNWVEQRFDLERALRKAVGRGELEAFVQPIIDLRTGRVTSAEVLSRWTLEDGREIPPDAFIEVAEDSTLVVEIGRWVLDRAASLLATWEHDRRLGPLGLSVNLSGRHIDHPNVVADVSDALRRWNADPRRLAIEITETSLLRDLSEAAATLRELHEIGVSISVDDFGVGYASLRYLRELPVELVKIDRSIVAGFERVDSDTVIVTMLSRLADVLDISIVAEGVETEEQRERLADIGCHYAQGFLFAPAMAVPEFERWLEHWERQHTHPARWHELLND